MKRSTNHLKHASSLPTLDTRNNISYRSIYVFTRCQSFSILDFCVILFVAMVNLKKHDELGCGCQKQRFSNGFLGKAWMEPTCSSHELHAPTCAILDDENLEPANDLSLALNAASMLE